MPCFLPKRIWDFSKHEKGYVKGVSLKLALYINNSSFIHLICVSLCFGESDVKFCSLALVPCNFVLSQLCIKNKI